MRLKWTHVFALMTAVAVFAGVEWRPVWFAAAVFSALATIDMIVNHPDATP